MNKTLVHFLTTIFLAGIFGLVLPWWSVMIATLITGFALPLEKVKVFLTPFLAIFLYWGIYCWILSSNNDFILAKKIARLFPLDENPYLLIVLTGIVGGLAAGTSGWLGKELHTLRK